MPQKEIIYTFYMTVYNDQSATAVTNKKRRLLSSSLVHSLVTILKKNLKDKLFKDLVARAFLYFILPTKKLFFGERVELETPGITICSNQLSISLMSNQVKMTI